MRDARRTSRKVTQPLRAIACVAGAAWVFATGSAQARIQCDGAFQIIKGQPHATPYCEDAYLGAVARKYGMRVSDAAIRNSPGTKRDVCRAIGSDTRVWNICASVLDRGGPSYPR